MYSDIHISVLGKGGYVVQDVSGGPSSYHAPVAAFSNKAELLAWLKINLESRSPDLVDRHPQAPASTKDTDDEIPF